MRGIDVNQSANCYIVLYNSNQLKKITNTQKLFDQNVSIYTFVYHWKSTSPNAPKTTRAQPDHNIAILLLTWRRLSFLSKCAARFIEDNLDAINSSNSPVLIMKDARVWWRDLFCLPLTLLYSPLLSHIDLQFTAIRGFQIFTLMFICEYFRPQGHIKHFCYSSILRGFLSKSLFRQNIT